MSMMDKKAWVCGLLCILFALSLAGCSGRPTGLEELQARDDEKPPETAGSLEDLVGTTWELGNGQTLTFGKDGRGLAERPNAVPLDMRYELKPNGVITVTLFGASRSGTWDGTTLIIGGETAKRVANQGRQRIPTPPAGQPARAPR